MSTIDATPSGGPVKKDDRLIYLISMAQLTLRTRINTLFSGADLRVTLPQATVLFLLPEKDCRMMSEMGRGHWRGQLGHDGSCRQAREAGLVCREAKREDRRALLIRITPEGRSEAARTAKIIGGVNEKIQEGFEVGPIEAFKEVILGLIGIQKQLNWRET
jgi:hypothetical protein